MNLVNGEAGEYGESVLVLPSPELHWQYKWSKVTGATLQSTGAELSEKLKKLFETRCVRAPVGENDTIFAYGQKQHSEQS